MYLPCGPQLPDGLLPGKPLIVLCHFRGNQVAYRVPRAHVRSHERRINCILAGQVQVDHKTGESVGSIDRRLTSPWQEEQKEQKGQRTLLLLGRQIFLPTHLPRHWILETRNADHSSSPYASPPILTEDISTISTRSSGPWFLVTQPQLRPASREPATALSPDIISCPPIFAV